MLDVRAKKRLAAALAKQGARVKPTKSGYLVFTDRGTMGFHLSASSDKNGDSALRRDVVRLGLEWPFSK